MKKINTLVGIALLFGVATTSYAQRLTAAGVSGSFNVARLHTGQGTFQLGNVTVDPKFDQSNDETGNGINVFGRWQLGRTTGWYVQPELGYVSTLATPVLLSHGSGNESYFGQRVRHLDARLLGGYQAGPLRLFAGPVVGYFLRQKNDYNSQSDDLSSAIATLNAAGPTRVQAAIQAGVGVSLWRVDVNARYEWSLTRYGRLYDNQLKTNYLTQNLQQLILEVGFRIYNNTTAE